MVICVIRGQISGQNLKSLGHQHLYNNLKTNELYLATQTLGHQMGRLTIMIINTYSAGDPITQKYIYSGFLQLRPKLIMNYKL